MRNYGLFFSFAAVVLGCVGIGAHLIENDHLWTGILAMLIGGSVSAKTGK